MNESHDTPRRSLDDAIEQTLAPAVVPVIVEPVIVEPVVVEQVVAIEPVAAVDAPYEVAMSQPDLQTISERLHERIHAATPADEAPAPASDHFAVDEFRRAVDELGSRVAEQAAASLAAAQSEAAALRDERASRALNILRALDASAAQLLTTGQDVQAALEQIQQIAAYVVELQEGT